MGGDTDVILEDPGESRIHRKDDRLVSHGFYLSMTTAIFITCVSYLLKTKTTTTNNNIKSLRNV